MQRRIRIHIGIFAALFFLLHTYSIAQLNGGIYHKLTTENGLSSNLVTDVIQDHEGLYWIGTQDGLNCFDGSTCRIFRNTRNDTTSLSHNDCVALVEDDNGDIWTGTQLGLNRYKRKEGKFERFFFNNPKYSFEQVNSIRGLTKDEEGNIWVCSAGLWQYNIRSHKWKAWLNDPKDSSSIPRGYAAYLQYDKINHGLWMTLYDGFIFFNLSSHKFFSPQNNPAKLGIFNVSVADGIFSLDDKNNVWFHTLTNKLCRYSISANKLEEAPPLAVYPGLSHLTADHAGRIWLHYWIEKTLIYNTRTRTFDSTFLKYFHPQSPLTIFTRGLYIDKENNYWIYSNKGISIYNPNEQVVHYYILNDQRKLSRSVDFAISCFAEQNDSILWVGTNDGLYQYNTREMKGKLFPDIKVQDNFIRCLFIQHDSVLWIGGHRELIRFDLKRSRITQQIRSIENVQMITEDANKNIWVATWANGLYEFSPDGRQSRQFLHRSDTLKTPVSNYFLCLSWSGDKKTAWMGFNGGAGFSKYDFAAGTFSNFKIHDSSDSKEASNINIVNCITEDKNGNLWLGTYGGGLAFYDLRKKNYTTFTQSAGLKGNFINGIVDDNNNHLWIETTNGLSIMDLINHTIISSDIALGQESNDFFQNGLFRKNKNVLFFSKATIVEIDPIGFLQSAQTSKIVYSSFKVFDQEKILSGTDGGRLELKLPHSQNFFSFEYSLLRSNPQQEVQYAYQLKGFDPDWNYAGERRTAYYTNVFPGHYVFTVKATDATGKWRYFSEPVYINIKPPVWQTLWFRILVLLLIGGTIYVLFRYRVNQLKKIYQLRSKISQDLHDEIASTLSGIRLYSELAKQQLDQNNESKAKESLEIISSRAAEMKGGISDIVWAINPSNDSFSAILEKLKAYAMEVSAAAGISFEFNMETAMPDEKLDMPQRRNIYLICKEAANNAVKYSKAGKLAIRFYQLNQIIIIEIKDNGVGFDPQLLSLGNGVFNMKRRAKEIGALLSIKSSPGEGSSIELKIRL